MVCFLIGWRYGGFWVRGWDEMFMNGGEGGDGG